jgi:hypothetical protein
LSRFCQENIFCRINTEREQPKIFVISSIFFASSSVQTKAIVFVIALSFFGLPTPGRLPPLFSVFMSYPLYKNLQFFLPCLMIYNQIPLASFLYGFRKSIKTVARPTAQRTEIGNYKASYFKSFHTAPLKNQSA